MRNDRVVIFDTTLRDGEQSLSSSLSVKQKLRIAHQLARLSVDVIEAGFPVSSPGDFESVATVAKEVRIPVICGLARAIEKDIKVCAQALKHAARPRIHTFIGTSPIHRKGQLRKSKAEVLEMVRQSVRLARRCCPDVEFSPMDAGRTEHDFLCAVVERAIRCGARTVNIPDTVGYTTPEQFASLIDMLFERVPDIDKAIISVHCHDDLGMATANSLTAVAHGVRQIECSMNGIGERAGNTALEEVVMALKVRRDLFGVTTGVATHELVRTSRLVREICNMPVQPNKAVVGSNAFAHSSGIHQDGVLKVKQTYEIMTPASVGLKEHRMNLTSRSGSHMVESRLKALGYRKSDIDIKEFYRRFVALADRKGSVYDDDLIALMESKHEKEITDRYTLEYLNVSSGRGTVPTATARIAVDGKVFEEASTGDGAVDAATKAIDRIAGFRVTMENYHVESVTGGREAQGRVTITARAAEGVFTGVGTSTDIVEASALAYMDIINKIARMRKYKRKLSE